jgi:hypothetical protein
VVADEPSEPVLITEGEKKAACACKKKLLTIGLGGVSNFRGPDKQLLPELQEFNWKDRSVWIVFDSDQSANPQVAREQSILAMMLRDRGAIVKAIKLPSSKNGEKVALDDFLMQKNGKAKLIKLSAQAVSPFIGTEEILIALNTELVVIKHPTEVRSLAEGLRPPTKR